MDDFKAAVWLDKPVQCIISVKYYFLYLVYLVMNSMAKIYCRLGLRPPVTYF